MHFDFCPHNVAALMAARKQLWHPDEVRQKIQASQLITQLGRRL